MPPKFKKILAGDETLDRVQNNVAEALDPLLGSPLNNALLISKMLDAQGHQVDLQLDNTYRNIPHGLGRKPFGWLPVSPQGSSTFYEDPVVGPLNNPDPTKFLRLQALTTVTVKILVF